jgi:hypothetical protein
MFDEVLSCHGLYDIMYGLVKFYDIKYMSYYQVYSWHHVILYSCTTSCQTMEHHVPLFF